MFTIKLIHYINGVLDVTHHKVDRLEDAIEHGIKAAVHSYKVYDEENNLCHDSKDHDHDHDHYA